MERTTGRVCYADHLPAFQLTQWSIVEVRGIRYLVDPALRGRRVYPLRPPRYVPLSPA